MSNSTPRTLIRAVQRDLSPELQAPTRTSRKTGEPKDLMRAFISADVLMSKEYGRILDHPEFSGCFPRIVDKVFYLERFADELPRTASKTPSPRNSKNIKRPNNIATDPYINYTPNQFTSFEHSLICINLTLVVGIVLTMIVLGMFFLFLNNALYLQEEIS